MLRITLACFALVFFASASVAQEPTSDEIPATLTAEDEAAAKDDEAFDQSILDFGALAGNALNCLSEEADLKTHEGRVFEAYAKLVQLFGTERAFKFAASYGYGTGEENDAEKCKAIVDQFTDQYGAIAAKYELVDGE